MGIRRDNSLAPSGGRVPNRRERERMDNLAEAMLNCLFDEEGVPYSTVISGGREQERTAALMEMLRHCVKGRLPVFILHTGNDKLRSSFTRLSRCVFVPGQKSFFAFDLLSSLKPDMITDILYETGERTCHCSLQLRRALRFGINLIQQAGELCTLENLCTFPWDNMGDYISDHQDQLDVLAAMNRLGSLSSGIEEAEVLFSRLGSEPLPIVKEGVPALDLQEVFQEGGCVCIDLVSDGNRLLTELIIATLDRLRSSGFRFLTVVDSLPLNENSLLLTLLSGRKRKTPTIYLSPDCTAVRGMGEAERHSVLGGPLNLILFSHRNGDSADQLSRLFSEHDDYTVSNTTGVSRENLALIQKNYSNSRTITELRRRNIQPEEIMGLPPEVALVCPVGAGQAYMTIQFGAS